jgi:hypothetical protein
MGIYAGMGVSDKVTHVCVVDADGVVLRRDVVASDPDYGITVTRDYGGDYGDTCTCPRISTYLHVRGDIFSPISISAGPSVNMIPLPPFPVSGHYSQGKTSLAPAPFTNLVDC